MRNFRLIAESDLPAAWRAAESAKPENERICFDPLAKDFLSMNPLLRKIILWYSGRLMPSTFPALAARTACFDDYLRKCIDNGIKQVVNLGAGFDSRAYRFKELKEKVKVFEVDHPNAQKVKVEKVKKIFGSLPDHVVYVPIDFGKEKLADKLFESGYNKDVKTLFIWESVSHLLTENEADSILSFVAKNSGSGSSIIFDYQFKSVLDGKNESKGAKGLRKVVKRSDGQPNFELEEEQVKDFLSQKGFYQVNNVNGEFLKNAYVKGADQSKEFYTLWGIVHATVKPRE